MKSFVKIGIGICFLTLLFSCRDDKDFSDIPELFYRDFTVVDQGGTEGLLATWKLGFTDGDGNIGVRNEADSANFIVTAFRTDSGKLKQLPQLNNYRIPAAENISTRNGIEGEFKFVLKLIDYQMENIDSVYLEGYVLDRDLNASNVISTPIFLD
jgi:hypothetical protein